MASSAWRRPTRSCAAARTSSCWSEPGSGQSAGSACGFRHLHATANQIAAAIRARALWKDRSARAGEPLVGEKGALRLGGDVALDAARLRAAGVPAEVPATLCLAISVVLVREAWRIDSRLDDMRPASSFVTVIGEEANAHVEAVIRRLGRETVRVLNTWASLYAAMGGIAPLAIAFARDEDPVRPSLIAVVVVALALATRALLVEERRALREIDRFEQGLAAVERTAECLTRPLTVQD